MWISRADARGQVCRAGQARESRGACRDHMRTNAGPLARIWPATTSGLLAQVAVGFAGFLGFPGLALTGFRAFAGLMLSGLPALTGVASMMARAGNAPGSPG